MSSGTSVLMGSGVRSGQFICVMGAGVAFFAGFAGIARTVVGRGRDLIAIVSLLRAVILSWIGEVTPRDSWKWVRKKRDGLERR